MLFPMKDPAWPWCHLWLIFMPSHQQKIILLYEGVEQTYLVVYESKLHLWCHVHLSNISLTSQSTGPSLPLSGTSQWAMAQVPRLWLALDLLKLLERFCQPKACQIPGFTRITCCFTEFYCKFTWIQWFHTLCQNFWQLKRIMCHLAISVQQVTSPTLRWNLEQWTQTNKNHDQPLSQWPMPIHIWYIL